MGGLGSKLGGFGSILAPSWVSSWLPHVAHLTYQKPYKNHTFSILLEVSDGHLVSKLGDLWAIVAPRLRILGQLGYLKRHLGATWPLEGATWPLEGTLGIKS